MQISKAQIEQVNKQIGALVKAGSFYGKKLAEAGFDSIETPEDFEKLPFSEKADLREAYPLGLMTAFFFRHYGSSRHHPLYREGRGRLGHHVQALLRDGGHHEP